MNISENLKDLAEEFPISMADTYCGADCGDGWKPLIRKALQVLEKHKVTVAQIKEKFGGLRINIEPPNEDWKDGIFEECYEAIKQVEEESFKICEVCGSEGKLRSGEWLRTLCDNHARSE